MESKLLLVDEAHALRDVGDHGRLVVEALLVAGHLHRLAAGDDAKKLVVRSCASFGMAASTCPVLSMTRARDTTLCTTI